MRGAQRRIEARIGQLLGPTTKGGRTDRRQPSVMAEGLSKDERREFRLLAGAFRRRGA